MPTRVGEGKRKETKEKKKKEKDKNGWDDWACRSIYVAHPITAVKETQIIEGIF
jgi:hypothetical protein